MKKVLLMFFMYLNLFANENVLSLNYKENEPLLGKGYYLVLSDIPVANYPNTIGYFSSVDIEGKNLPIEKDLEKVSIKKDGILIIEKNVEWDQYTFSLNEIDLDGLKINLKWKSINRQKMELMISEWDLLKKQYKIEVEYHYPDRKEILNLNLNMPQFNPEIYLNFDYKLPILKKQELGKKYIILKKIGLNDYDLEITKNTINSEGLKLELAEKVSIKGTGEDEEYSEVARVLSLLEVYPKIFVENSSENIFENSKDVYIALELPHNLELSKSYVVNEEILSLSYNKIKKRVIEKVVILPQNNEVSKKIALNKWYIPGEKIYIDDFKETTGYYLLEGEGEIVGKYANLKIKVDEIEEMIDGFGESEEIHLNFIRMKVENGRVSICIDKPKELVQGKEVEYKILDAKGNVLEKVKLNFYIEN
ncbi:hypothetical protein [Cetobacterium sp.]|uniref:hypothetical protein n=1 Tax=Cetobacterium sp. TaxID=2071632 RepID=UPI003F342620